MKQLDQLERHGISLQYPENWEIEEESDDERYTASLSSADTSFWTMTVFFDRPEPAYVLQQALDSLEEEYEDLDTYPVATRICDCETEGMDVSFVCLELTNSAFLRCFQVAEGTVLLYYQSTDEELVETRAIMDAITQSLEAAD